MLRPVQIACVLLALIAHPIAGQAQDSPSRPPRPAEAEVIGGAGIAQSVFNSAPDRDFVTVILNQGWFLSKTARETGELVGPKMMIEFVPVFVMNQSTRVYGVGVTPLFLRYYFPSGSTTVKPFIEIAGGFLFFERQVPERTSRFAFTAHSGLGLRIATGSRTAVLLGYRFHHISNGQTAEANPGVNSHMAYLGFSFRQR